MKNLLTLFSAALLLTSNAYAQMQHAVLYAPVKMETIGIEVDAKTGEPVKGGAVLEAFAIGVECKIGHVWHVKNINENYAVWYGYMMPDEIDCVQKSGVAKIWYGPSAKAAWKEAYASGLPEAKSAVDLAVKVPVKVFDSEVGAQVEKYLLVAEAKALDDKAAVTADLFDRPGDAMLPRKIFDGSK